jgi:hypothetical protein
LYTRTNFAELRSLFEDCDSMTGSCNANGRRKSTESGSNNHDVKLQLTHFPPVLLYTV